MLMSACFGAETECQLCEPKVFDPKLESKLAQTVVKAASESGVVNVNKLILITFDLSEHGLILFF